MKRTIQLLAIASVLFVSGCQSDWGTASGTASVDGQRMKKGVVTFHPKAGGATAYATVGTDGSFSAKTGADNGLKTGDYVVTVTDHFIPDSSSGEQAKLLTPEKYATPEKSDLKVTVNSGGNTFHFDLKK